MTFVARRRAAVLVPWLALAAVTAFAIVQMRARHEAVRDAPPLAAETPPSPASPASPVAGSAPTEAALRAEEALDAALADLEAARAEAGSRAREGVLASARAEAAEARLAAHTARAEALEQEIASLRAAAAERAAEAAEAASTPPAPSEQAAWVEDAGADDPRRRRRAVERAAAATPDQVAGLEARRVAGADLLALARLAAALPSGDATDALVVGLLLDGPVDVGRAGRLVTALGSDPLLRPVVMQALLGRASPGMLKVALGQLAGREADLGDPDARAALTAALAPRFQSSDASQLHAGARAAGILRLPGTAPRLVPLLDHEGAAVRAVAAHALSRVPDLDTVRAGAVKALPGLLLDGSLSVRMAGTLLAETLLGAQVDYDPASGEGARREALDRLLDRLE